MYEKNRRTQKTLFGESQDKDDSVQLPTRYEQYTNAKRHLRGTSRPEVFPIEQGGGQNLKYFGGVISAREQWLKDGNTYSRNFSQGQRIYSTDGISQTLAGNAGGQGGKTGLYQISNSSPREMEFRDVSPTLLTRDYKDPKFVSTPYQIRRLTPTECERLQGFPDGWTEGVSDTQRYKCLGNAVTVNVIKEIMKAINDSYEG